MKLSELILQAQEQLDKFGDLEVLVDDDGKCEIETQKNTDKGTIWT